jgi:hypothetical protein
MSFMRLTKEEGRNQFSLKGWLMFKVSVSTSAHVSQKDRALLGNSTGTP